MTFAGQIAGYHIWSKDIMKEIRQNNMSVNTTHGLVIVGDHRHFDSYALMLECMHNVWRSEFPPVPDESMWPLVSSALFKLAPNMNLHHVLKSRATFTQIRTNMDVHERDN
ncbi:hypothetical protein J1N35_001216 [Gossypium stocksii]|uniref:Uncharacterized protein n=1 Tax=Gossypium stocksii TaxID=47602 RepID=A0A9D3WK06_9ROSI|nr:hypothetical protein J1N35_001216 [Gossypium stocksii]